MINKGTEGLENESHRLADHQYQVLYSVFWWATGPATCIATTNTVARLRSRSAQIRLFGGGGVAVTKLVVGTESETVRSKGQVDIVNPSYANATWSGKSEAISLINPI